MYYVRTASMLSDYRGTLLSLDGLTTFTLGSARALSRYKGVLSLGGLESITTPIDRAIATHQGPELRLEALRSIAAQPAMALLQHEGRLVLSGVDAFPNSVHPALSKRAGRTALAP